MKHNKIFNTVGSQNFDGLLSFLALLSFACFLAFNK